MMAYEPVDAIEVSAWGRSVGVVARNPANGQFAFRYDPAWVTAGVELAPLHMPLVEGTTYDFTQLSKGEGWEAFRGLPPLLADALPDRFGNALVDRWMAEHDIAQSAFSVLDRLAYAADRALGALEFRPPLPPADELEPSAVQLADLVVAARSAVAKDAVDVDRRVIEQLLAVGTSAGGARPKAIVAYNPMTAQIRSAYKELPVGFEHWLFKLDGVNATALDGHTAALTDSAPFGRIEYAYSQMAMAAGIDMEQCELLAEGPRRHFITRRFDRDAAGEKHHVISLCALAHLDFNMIGAHSYDQYFETISTLGLDVDALAQAFRRMVFNVAAANCDDHTKNFSFLRRQDGDWELAPAFDITYSFNPESVWVRQHLMSVNGRTADIELEDLYSVGERHDVPAYRRIVGEVLDVVGEWPSFAIDADVPSDSIEQITKVLAEHRPM